MPELKQCPFLPVEVRPKPWRHAAERGEGFYYDALTYAQGYWLEGKPGQAILQLNKAFSADLTDDADILRQWPMPYRALEWILRQAVEVNEGFLGNPVRHFQHLATRMSGDGSLTKLRIKRAWACYWIAQSVLGARGGFPKDARQLAREGVYVPADRGWRG